MEGTDICPHGAVFIYCETCQVENKDVHREAANKYEQEGQQQKLSKPGFLNDILILALNRKNVSKTYS